MFVRLFIFSLFSLSQCRSVSKLDECHRFYSTQTCYYFPCLDSYYSCGVNSYLARFSYDLCILTTKKYSQQLTKNAQLYFNHTNECVITSLHDQLTENTISAKFSCTRLETRIFEIYSNCLKNIQRENKLVTIIDFCSIICDNLQALIDIFFNLNHVHLNLHRLLVGTGKSCGAEIDESVTHTLPSLLMSICIDRKNVRLRDDIKNIMFNQRYEPSDYEWISEI